MELKQTENIFANIYKYTTTRVRCICSGKKHMLNHQNLYTKQNIWQIDVNTRAEKQATTTKGKQYNPNDSNSNCSHRPHETTTQQL